MKQSLLLISLLFFLVASGQRSVDLNKGWEFRKAGTVKWFKAAVPGTIHTDLLANELIPDPFYRDNESQVQWVEEATWEYRTTFDLTKELLQQKHLEIQFDGLDTYAEVYLNGKKIIAADNMFRRWAADVRSFVKPKANKLLVVFPPAATMARLAKQADSITRPDNERVYIRKAQYQFGWDWGPRLVTSGIWKDVRLFGWDIVRITETAVTYHNDSVNLRVIIETDSSGVFYVTSRCYNDTAGMKFIPPFSYVSDGIQLWKGGSLVELQIPINEFVCDKNGVAGVNDIGLGIMSDDTRMLFFSQLMFGKRDVQLVIQKDTTGESFYFTVNGKPSFIKGANWIPADNFLPRAKKLKRYEQLIKAAKEANINMLRVWGGGVYEDDIFYDLCDKYGIMVWQDFMFAGALYPADSAFLRNIGEEVRYQVGRLRHHPSIVLWCGNNEIEEAWFNWGWQKQFKYSVADSLKLWNDYKKIFHELIPGVLQELDPQRPYWPSSPSLGWGRDSAYKKGDVHYWGVWWGKEPVEKYNEKTGRFVSEYGMQGMPDMKTIRQFSLPADWDTSSAVMRTHQKHPFGWANIKYYIEQKFRTPKSFEDLVYVSQLMQADAIKTAIESHRRNKPVTMGTMFWQWNDCWPVTSWSAVDYYERKKAMYYEVKRSFSDLQILLSYDSLNYYWKVINESKDVDSVDVLIHCIDHDGSGMYSFMAGHGAFFIKADTIMTGWMPRPGIFKEEIGLRASLRRKGKTVTSSYIFFRSPKDFGLRDPQIKYEIKANSTIEITGKKFAYGVFIDVPDGVELDDNYFHLAPKEKKIVKFKSTLSAEELLKKIKIKSLVDTY